MNKNILEDLYFILAYLDSESEIYISVEEAVSLCEAFIEGKLVWVDSNYGDDNDSN